MAKATDLKIENHSIDYITSSKRTGKISKQGWFWFLGNFHFFTLSIGFLGPLFGLTSLWTFIAGMLGIMLGTIFMAFHGSQGYEMGLPQMIQSRAQFGFKGVIIALFATFVVFVGFNIVNIALIVDGLYEVFQLNANLVILGVVILGTVLTIFGHDLIHKAFEMALLKALPLYLIITILLLFWITPTPEAVNYSKELGFNWIGFFSLFSVAASYNIAYAPYVSDYTRYLPTDTSRPKLILAIFLGASFSGAWMIGLGGLIAEKLQSNNALLAMQMLGDTIHSSVGVIFVIVATLSFLPIISLNMYSASLTLITAFDSIKQVSSEDNLKARVWSTLFIAAIILVLSYTFSGSAITQLYILLLILLSFLIPWTAINLVDYFFIRRSHYAIYDLFHAKGIYGTWAWDGIICYFVGFLSMIPFMAIFNPVTGEPVFIGFMAKHLNDIDLGWLIGLLVSATLYYLINRNYDVSKEKEAVKNSHKKIQQLEQEEA